MYCKMVPPVPIKAGGHLIGGTTCYSTSLLRLLNQQHKYPIAQSGYILHKCRLARIWELHIALRIEQHRKEKGRMCGWEGVDDVRKACHEQSLSRAKHVTSKACHEEFAEFGTWH